MESLSARRSDIRKPSTPAGRWTARVKVRRNPGLEAQPRTRATCRICVVATRRGRWRAHVVEIWGKWIRLVIGVIAKGARGDRPRRSARQRQHAARREPRPLEEVNICTRTPAHHCVPTIEQDVSGRKEFAYGIRLERLALCEYGIGGFPRCTFHHPSTSF
jgi:hypothetical protein